MSTDENICRNENEDKKYVETYVPVCTIGLIVILPLVIAGSFVTYFSGDSMKLYNTGEDVAFRGQIYRLLTCPFAVYSLRELLTMIFCIPLLVYYLPLYVNSQ